MDLEDVFEMLTMENVSEGLGAAAAIGLLMGLFFGGGLTPIVEALMNNVG